MEARLREANGLVVMTMVGTAERFDGIQGIIGQAGKLEGMTDTAEVFSALCALRSALCALRSAPCALRPALCALRSALCALRSAFCALRAAC